MTDRHELAEVLDRLRHDLVEEATPLPGQQLSYGRPHEHPRTRSFKHYSKSGQRIEGETRIGPDCPRPVRGRCECPPDGSWRPAVGVIRADSTATHAVQVPAERLRPALEGVFWVADVYVQEPDGLWHCRWPTRAALERLRGASPRRWAVAVGLLRGDHVTAVWGAMGIPPNPTVEAFWDPRREPTEADGEAIRSMALVEHVAAGHPRG